LILGQSCCLQTCRAGKVVTLHRGVQHSHDLYKLRGSSLAHTRYSFHSFLEVARQHLVTHQTFEFSNSWVGPCAVLAAPCASEACPGRARAGHRTGPPDLPGRAAASHAGRPPRARRCVRARRACQPGCRVHRAGGLRSGGGADEDDPRSRCLPWTAEELVGLGSTGTRGELTSRHGRVVSGSLRFGEKPAA